MTRGLGTKRHKDCENLTKRKYRTCRQSNDYIMCFHIDKPGYDIVNLKTKTYRLDPNYYLTPKARRSYNSYHTPHNTPSEPCLIT